MGILIAIVAVVIIAAAGALWWRWLTKRQLLWRDRLASHIPVNSKFWREQKALPGELLYVAIGDSAAQGIGASRPEHSYVGMLAKHMRARLAAANDPRMLRVANLAISGATVPMAVELELPQLRRLEPDLVTVCIGANDIANWDEERFRSGIRAVFDDLPAHAIVADLPSFYFLPGEKKVLVANRIVSEEAAKRGLQLVGLHALTRRQGLPGIVTQFAGDLFHPNDRGYRVWAKAFEAAVDERLEALRTRPAEDHPAG
ncbi:MAG: SGNH/GDSL hydrolase family protein [Rhodoglobus sp.]